MNLESELKAFNIIKKEKGTFTSGEPYLSIYCELNNHFYIFESDSKSYLILDSECQLILKTRSLKKLRRKINEIERIASEL